jgi:hypothetical protein
VKTTAAAAAAAAAPYEHFTDPIAWRLLVPAVECQTQLVRCMTGIAATATAAIAIMNLVKFVMIVDVCFGHVCPHI